MNLLPLWATASASAMPPYRTHRTVTPPETRSPALRSHERAAMCLSGHPRGEHTQGSILAALPKPARGSLLASRQACMPGTQAPAPSEIGASTTPNDGARSGCNLERAREGLLRDEYRG
jgi:hypothetical protein